MGFKDLRDSANARNELLKAHEFSNCILIVHYEGVLVRDNAFLEVVEHEGCEYIIVYGEHVSPPEIYDMDLVTKYAQFPVNYGGYL